MRPSNGPGPKCMAQAPQNWRQVPAALPTAPSNPGQKKQGPYKNTESIRGMAILHEQSIIVPLYARHCSSAMLIHSRESSSVFTPHSGSTQRAAPGLPGWLKPAARPPLLLCCPPTHRAMPVVLVPPSAGSSQMTTQPAGCRFTWCTGRRPRGGGREAAAGASDPARGLHSTAWRSIQK